MSTAASPPALRRRATLIGAGAVGLWAMLAPLAAATGRTPPFQTTAAAFAVAFVLTLAVWLARGERPIRHLRQPAKVWLLGVYGLFGYHALYFLALKLAPPVEASLINYLWPLLIVVFAGLLPGESLRLRHLAGAALGFAGVALLIGGVGGQVGFRAEYLPGYVAAFGCALVWSSYSVLSRRFAEVPTDAVGGFCGATALLAFACHLAFETTVMPTWPEALATLALGLGPTGAAFFLWDIGMKRGDIQLLGSLAYAAPVLSTLLLVLFGQAEPSWTIAAACAAVTIGAAIAVGIGRPATRL